MNEVLVFVTDPHGLGGCSAPEVISRFLSKHLETEVPVETIATADHVVLCMKGGDMLGVALMFADEERVLDVQFLCVHKKRRYEGIASRMFEEAKAHGKAWEYSGIKVKVGAEDAHFTSRGFVARERTDTSVLMQWDA